jgi:hypothetical protein
MSREVGRVTNRPRKPSWPLLWPLKKAASDWDVQRGRSENCSRFAFQ